MLKSFLTRLGVYTSLEQEAEQLPEPARTAVLHRHGAPIPPPKTPRGRCQVPELSPPPTFKPLRGYKPTAVRRIFDAQAAETAAAIKRLSMPVAPLFSFVSPAAFAPPTPPDAVERAKLRRKAKTEIGWRKAGDTKDAAIEKAQTETLSVATSPPAGKPARKPRAAVTRQPVAKVSTPRRKRTRKATARGSGAAHEVIAEKLRGKPELLALSNREIARELKSTHPTVAKARGLLVSHP